MICFLIHAATLIDFNLLYTQPMGWTSWKAYHFETNEHDVRAAAEGVVASGMRDAGYTELSMDGGWWGGGKSGIVRRNASGFFTGR